MIWSSCHGETHISKVSGTLYRLVESQEQIATLSFVDTLEEQSLLEHMLENTKPPHHKTNTGYHYLLSTPFRYPPLKWGSRFGKTTEPSLFYGGLDIDVTLAESAYYRFVFWRSIDAPPIKTNMHTEHSFFSIDYHSNSGIQLHTSPFSQYAKQLTNPDNYSSTQQLGTAMRKAGVEAFEYQSARDVKKGLCIGIFTIGSFKQKKPKNIEQWLCEVDANKVLFKQFGASKVYSFNLDHFLVNNQFPSSA